MAVIVPPLEQVGVVCIPDEGGRRAAEAMHCSIF
jgi:hypothetical protein